MVLSDEGVWVVSREKVNPSLPLFLKVFIMRVNAWIRDLSEKLVAKLQRE